MVGTTERSLPPTLLDPREAIEQHNTSSPGTTLMSNMNIDHVQAPLENAEQVRYLMKFILQAQDAQVPLSIQLTGAQAMRCVEKLLQFNVLGKENVSNTAQDEITISIVPETTAAAKPTSVDG